MDVTKQTGVRIPMDWNALFLQFAKQDKTISATGWLKSIGWPDNKVYNGNTALQIKDWRRKRVELRAKIIDQQMQEARELFSDILPELINDKSKIFWFYHDELNHLIARKDMKGISHILTKIKTELGEPAIITKQNTEDVGEHEDPAMKLLMMMGVIKADGSINLGIASAEVTTAQSDAAAPTESA